MATEFFNNCIFKGSERISDSKLKSKLVPNQIIKPLLCVFINFSLKNSYRIKIRIASMTSGKEGFRIEGTVDFDFVHLGTKF